jgi:protein arginine N-methyltransferase 1
MEGVVEVIEGSIEDITLPEQVDIIISEWMGYFLVRESMFDSVIYARDRWLKPTGMMYPSHARMFLAPMQTSLGERKIQEYQHAMSDWDRFTQDTHDQYGVDMSVLNNPYREEQRKYFLQTSVWNSLHPNQIIGQPALVKEFDCLKATLEEVSIVRSQFRIPIDSGNLKIAGFAGWFDVHFRGCPSDPADNEVELTTAPSVDDTTHWGQQVFLLHPPVSTRTGDVLVGELDITRSVQNHRLMDVKVAHSLERQGSPAAMPTISTFFIE